MKKSYTVLKGFIKMILSILLMYLVLIYGFGVFQDVKESPKLLIFIYGVMALFWFRDYKIVIDDNGIQFYSIFQKNKFYEWNSIRKIQFTKESYGRLEVLVLIMHICTENNKFSFSLERFNKKVILKEVINRCSRYHIEMNDLTSKKK